MICMKKIFFIFALFLSLDAFGVVNNDVVDGCGEPNLYVEDGYAKMIAVFDTVSYTCANGYFLPANSEECVPCPSGFNCVGGNFGFNETFAQGIEGNPIVTQNTSNICSDNVLQVMDNNHVGMIAVFGPATINLNFDDGNGNTTTTTCTYGDTITIPETVPTRPGYTFAGWVVRQNDGE